MLALNMQSSPGLGSIREIDGLELLAEIEMKGVVGGTMFGAALWVAAGLGGALAVGVVVGACIYIFTS
ncbi:MAG: hypothetical protein KY464_01765 [Gemmatimonadetes bacterium]|nr:hypothetical protein [Gemmatimonadota bacterium]